MAMDFSVESYESKENKFDLEKTRGFLLGKAEDKAIYQDLFQKETDIQKLSVEDTCALTPGKLKELVIKPELTPQENLNRLRLIEYTKALQFIHESNQKNNWGLKSFNERWHLAGEQNDKLNQLHLLTEDTLEQLFIDTHSQELLETLQDNREKESHPIGNIKVFRGMYCNAKCIFCFQEQSDNEEVSQFVEANRKLEYSPDQLARTLLYSRLAYKIREVSFTGGETFVNKPHEFSRDVSIASEIGIPQISTMSNGRLLNENNIQQLIEAGLTHLIISIHTVNPITHFRILNWKDKDMLFERSKIEIKERIEDQHETVSNDELNNAISAVRNKFDSEYLPKNTEINSSPALQDMARRQITENIQKYYDHILDNVKKITASGKVTVRFNLAYNPDQIGTDLHGVVAFAESLGVKEVTLVEMIPGNETAVSLHTPVPDDSAFVALGFHVPENRNWNTGGIKIYRKPSGVSVATCNFGQLNELSYSETDSKNTEYTNFSGQTKEIILHPKGNLSPHTYKNIPQNNFLYAETI